MRWKKNGWKTVNGTEVKNKNEFQKLAKLCEEIDVKWVSCILILCNSDREYLTRCQKKSPQMIQLRKKSNQNLEMLNMRCKP